MHQEEIKNFRNFRVIVNKENLILKYLKWSFINLLFNQSKIKLCTNFIGFSSFPQPLRMILNGGSFNVQIHDTNSDWKVHQLQASVSTKPLCGVSGLWRWILHTGQPWWADASLHREALEKIHSIWTSDNEGMSPKQCMWQLEQSQSVHSRSKHGSELDHY